MSPSTHPAADQLSAFARGNLPPGEFEAVAEHIAACDSCCIAVKRVRGDSIVISSAGHQASAPAPNTPPPDVPDVSEGEIPRADPPLPPNVPPALLNHPQYQIIGELGVGGMGVVYKAEHRMMGRTVALKVIAPRLTSKPSAVSRFVQEVKAAAQLSHPNIVTAHDAGEAGGLHFLVMEYVEGISLERFVARRGGQLPVTLACHFARQVATGLQHAHEKGMVHRDIKPANLMVTRKGQVKILDFGLARFVREEESTAAGKPAATAANVVMGTPEYLSPEQARNSHTVDIRSDIYSLGCTLHYLLTGQIPFPNATTMMEKLLAHTRETPTPIQTLRLDVPDTLAAVLAKLMAKRSKDRYATPGEVATALAPYARGESQGAAPPPEPTTGQGTGSHGLVEPIEPELVIPPPPPPRPVVRPKIAPETEIPERTTPTGQQGSRTRSRGRKKKALQASRTQRWKVTVVTAAVVFGLAFAVVAGFAFKKLVDHPETVAETAVDSVPNSVAKNDPPPTPPAEKPPPPVVSPPIPTPPPPKTPPPKTPPPKTPPKSESLQKVLFILPNRGLWLADYDQPRIAFEKRGVKVVTAASQPDPARLFPASDNRGQPVEIQVTLTETTDLTGYQAVVFCGQDVSQYIKDGGGAQAAKKTIQQMLQLKRFVCAVDLGQRVLIEHGFLKGKKAARTTFLADNYTGNKWGIQWLPEKDGPVLSDRFLTCGKPADADKLVDRLVAAVQKKP